MKLNLKFIPLRFSIFWVPVLFCLTGSSAVYGQANVYQSGSTTQVSLLVRMTDGLQHTVDANIDTLLFKNSGGGGQFLYSENVFTEGTYFGAYGHHRPYQNLIFESDSTAHVWNLGAAHSDGSCNPCSDNAVTTTLKTLTIRDATLNFIVRKAPDVNPNTAARDYIESFIMQTGSANPASINFQNGHLLILDAFGGDDSVLFFRSDTVFNVTGSDNLIKIPGTGMSESLKRLHLNLNSGATFTIDSMLFSAPFSGQLSMATGSTLNVDKSRVALISANGSGLPSVIQDATVNVTDLFGKHASSLELSRPVFRRSVINLDNNTQLLSYNLTSGVIVAGNIEFEGDNQLNMGAGAIVAGSDETVPLFELSFRNGTTTIRNTNNAQSGVIKAADVNLDNAVVDVALGDLFSGSIEVLRLENSSILRNSKDLTFNNIKALHVTDSKLEGRMSFGNSQLLKAFIKDAELEIGSASRTSSTSFAFRGIDLGPDPDIKGKIDFSGQNLFVSRIDPVGKDVGIDSGIVTGIKSYADSLYFTRLNAFTDITSTVTGFANLGVRLEPFAVNMTAHDYATGGSAQDGVYDIVVFNAKSSGISAATADSDTTNFTLSDRLPALLTATQVSTPSADNLVSVKLALRPNNNLATHPAVTTPNQAGAVALIAHAATAGPSTVVPPTTTPPVVPPTTTPPTVAPPTTTHQVAVNTVTTQQISTHAASVHAGPYSSNITIALEQAGLVMHTVLNQAGGGRDASAGKVAASESRENGRRVWMDAGYAQGEVTGSGDLGDFKYSLSHVTIGADFAEVFDATLGAYFSYASHQMNEHDISAQQFTSDAYHVGLYLDKSDVGRWNLRGGLGYSYGDNESKRQAVFSNISASPKANFSSHSLYGGIQASTTMYRSSWVTLSPELGANYISYDQEAFSESGNPDLSLKLDSSTAHSIVTSIGINARFGPEVEVGGVYPLAFLRYEHDWYAANNSEHEVKAALVSHPDFKQTFVGQNRGSGSFVFGLGVASELTAKLKISGGMVYSKDSQGHQAGAGFNLAYQF